MPKEDEEITRALDMAVSHILVARFGHITPRTRAGMYRTAATMLLQVSNLLRERADEEQWMEATVRMIERERWR